VTLRRVALVGSLALAALGAAVGVSFAAFSSSTVNPGSSFTSDPDWTAPSANPAVVLVNGGGVPGYLRQGGGYRVYANVTDSGNPASGTASVTGNTSTFDSGVVAANLAAGAWTVGGQSYNRRSASLTANGTLAEGPYAFTLTLADNAGNNQTQAGFSVTVDNTAPSASDIQTTNVGGGTAGRPEPGDTVSYTYSEPMDPATILAGWDGTATAVTVTIDQRNPRDRILVNANLGNVELGSGAFVTSDAIFNGTMVMSGSVVTITLGSLVSGSVNTVAGNGTLRWTPAGSADDYAGNGSSTSTLNEPGPADPDF
jgi:hypothetical protein